MIGFLGEYEATVDAKGRFLLPAAIRRKLPENNPGQFVINRGFERCLSLYPMVNWEPIFEGISKLNDFDPKVREFRRFFLTEPPNWSWIPPAGCWYPPICANTPTSGRISYW